VCSALQLVSDGEGGMLQLQKRQIKEASVLLMAIHVLSTFIIDVVTLFWKNEENWEFCLHTFLKCFCLFDFAMYNVTYKGHM